MTAWGDKMHHIPDDAEVLGIAAFARVNSAGAPCFGVYFADMGLVALTGDVETAFAISVGMTLLRHLVYTESEDVAHNRIETAVQELAYAFFYVRGIASLPTATGGHFDVTPERQAELRRVIDTVLNDEGEQGDD